MDKISDSMMIFLVSIHVLFDCVLFSLVREDLEFELGEPFTFTTLESNDADVCDALVRFGKVLFQAIADLCED
jgi:hypothetical protein